MAFEQQYAELAAAADQAGPEAPAWTLTTAVDRSLLFRIDIEAPYEATLAVRGDFGLWTLRLVVGDGDERTVRVGMAGDYEGVLRNVGLALLETGEGLRAVGDAGDFEFIAAALNFALAIDEKPVVAEAAEALARMLMAAGSADEGIEMLLEYAIPSFHAIGQDRRAAELQQLAVRGSA